MLRTRVITAFIGGAAFLGLVAAGGWPFALMVLLLATIGFLEFARMDGRPVRRFDVVLASSAFGGLSPPLSRPPRRRGCAGCLPAWCLPCLPFPS